MPEAIKNFAYIVAITVVAIVALAITLLFVYTNYRDDGLSGEEILAMVAVIASVVNQITMIFLGRQNKGIAKESNGRTGARIEAANAAQDERWIEGNKTAVDKQNERRDASNEAANVRQDERNKGKGN